MKLTQQEKRALSDLTTILKSELEAVRVILYGSAATNAMDESSDIDLLVVLPEVTWDIEKQVIARCFDAELECGRVFSAVCMTEDELVNSPMVESPFIKNVLSQGLVL